VYSHAGVVGSNLRELTTALEPIGMAAEGHPIFGIVDHDPASPLPSFENGPTHIPQRPFRKIKPTAPGSNCPDWSQPRCCATGHHLATTTPSRNRALATRIRGSVRGFLWASCIAMACIGDSQAGGSWTRIDLPITSDGKKVSVPAAQFSTEEGYTVLLHREPAGAEVENVWVSLLLDDNTDWLISKKDVVVPAVNGHFSKDPEVLKLLGESQYWQESRAAGIAVWNGNTKFPYGAMMRGFVEGGTLSVSYRTVTGEKKARWPIQ